MNKISRILTLCLVTLALMCFAVPAAFAEGESKSHAVGMDFAGGVGSTMVIYTNESGKLPSMPESPSMEGFTFDGWYTEPIGGTKVTIATVFKEDSTIYAHWVVNSDSVQAPPAAAVQPDAHPALQFLQQHRGTLLVAGILLTTFAAAAAM